MLNLRRFVLLFHFFPDDVRDKTSEISIMAGAPDPTFGGLYGDKSQWQISLELLDKRLHNDLESMNRMRSFFDYADRRQLVFITCSSSMLN